DEFGFGQWETENTDDEDDDNGNENEDDTSSSRRPRKRNQTEMNKEEWWRITANGSMPINKKRKGLFGLSIEEMENQKDRDICWQDYGLPNDDDHKRGVPLVQYQQDENDDSSMQEHMLDTITSYQMARHANKPKIEINLKRDKEIIKKEEQVAKDEIKKHKERDRELNMTFEERLFNKKMKEEEEKNTQRFNALENLKSEQETSANDANNLLASSTVVQFKKRKHFYKKAPLDAAITEA
ncbi:hypothetical protein RFI_22547, partial [Reticulomyxa filosa]